jgi:streptomycin 6-kinase
MDKSHSLDFREDFRKNLISAFGREATADFLARLPDLITQAASRWDLEPGAPVDALSYNYVCYATRRPERSEAQAKGDFILKIGIPNRELTSEMECLKVWGNLENCPTARLLDCDPENGLLLLELLRPGETLATLTDDARAAEIAADLMSRLWIPAPEKHNFISLKSWFDGLQNLRPRFGGGTGPFPVSLVETVESLLPGLFHEDAPLYLIHGDCHHYNILSHDDEWRVIDPKGVVGAREYEVAPFMLNPVYQLRPNLKRETARRIDIFAERLGFDRQRLWAWTVAHSLLSAWWDLQDDGTGGEYATACGEVFLELG